MTTKSHWCPKCKSVVVAEREDFHSYYDWVKELIISELSSTIFSPLGSGRHFQCTKCHTPTRRSKNTSSLGSLILLGTMVMLMLIVLMLFVVGFIRQMLGLNAA